MTNKKGSSVIVLMFSILALLGLASFALDLGLILNQRYELQKAVESAALISASEFEPFESGGNFTIPTAAQITNPTTGNASLHYQALLNTNQVIQGVSATPTITIDIPSKAVKVEANATLRTYFLQALGVNEITIQAGAAAVNVPIYLNRRFPVPTGSILRGNGAYLDTDIRQPLGSVAALTTTVFNHNAELNSIYGAPDGSALSLGPGGFITLKMPASLVDGQGFDFAIYERGHAEGYSVYAGIDSNPDNPYADASSPGGGIKWIDISCTGVPLYVNKNELIGAHLKTTIINGASFPVVRFFGSGYFDLGAKCDVGGVTIYDGTGSVGTAPKISNVKYLKIIDDNREEGFFIQPKFGIPNPSAIPMLIPGEHSTFTPGADIDAIEIFHHSRLISLADFDNDTDGDGLIDIVERIYGLNPNNADSDSDGINDLTEILGYNTTTPPYTAADALHSGATPILFKDYPGWNNVPPVMEVIP